MVLVLTSITLVAAVALGSVYNLTKEPIEASQRAKQENAIMEVLTPDVLINRTDTITLEGMPELLYVYQAYA